MISIKNKSYLRAMAEVSRISKCLDTVSWVWGGLTADIYQNRLLREHEDLDYLTLNLHNLRDPLVAMFESCGWQTRLLANGDLKLGREGTYVHLGQVEVGREARWMHNGVEGSLWFPCDWLKVEPVNFYGLDIHVVAPELQYILLERPQLLNPEWRHRQKDRTALNYWRSHVEYRGIALQSLLERVH